MSRKFPALPFSRILFFVFLLAAATPPLCLFSPHPLSPFFGNVGRELFR